MPITTAMPDTNTQPPAVTITMDEAVTAVTVEQTALPIPETKGCKIEKVLRKSEIELLRLAPRNGTVRALVLARTGLNLPDNLTEFDQLKNYIEAEAKSPARIVPELCIPVEYAYTEHGVVNYTSRMVYRGTIELDAVQISNALRATYGHEGDLDTFVAFVKDILESSASDSVVRVGTETTDESRQVTTETDHMVIFDRNALYDLLRSYLQTNRPRDFEHLTGEGPQQEEDADEDENPL